MANTVLMIFFLSLFIFSCYFLLATFRRADFKSCASVTRLRRLHQERVVLFTPSVRKLNPIKMCSNPMALTESNSKSTDFTDWLLPDSRLQADFVFIIKFIGPSGDVEQERIAAHKAILAKSSKVFEDIIFKVGEISELEIAVGGTSGVEAFKLFLYKIYGRTIKMESISSYEVLANLAGFAKNYKLEDIKEAAVARMAELVEHEEDFEILTKLSSLASKFGLQSLATSTSNKIQTVITQELNTSVLAKFNSLEVKDVRDKIKTVSDLANLGTHHNVTSLKSAVAAHLEAVEVDEANFASLVEMADSTQLMAPLRKALARYIRVNYVYTEELAYFLKDNNFNMENILAILCQVQDKD